MKKNCCISLFSAGLFALAGVAFAQEHPEHPSVKKEVEPLTLPELSAAVRRHVEGETAKKGFYAVEDEVKKTTLKLKLDKIHEERLSHMGNDLYFICADFKADDGTVYDVDVFMHGTAKRDLKPSEKPRVHKVNGVPRYNWYEEGGIWKTKAAAKK